MAVFPSNNGQPSRAAANTDPNGPDAQDKLVGKMHKSAHKAHKAQRDLTHAAGKKGKR